MALTRKQPAIRASTPGSRLPDIPPPPASMLDLDGFVEYDRESRRWWDDVRTALGDINVNRDKDYFNLSKSITVGDATLSASITEERTLRISADDALASQITTLTAAYQAADASLSASITAEATARASADSAEASTRASADATLQTNINTVSASVTTETNARVSADNALASSITTLTANYQAADTTLQANITSEATARANADTALSNSITTVQANLDKKIKVSGSAPSSPTLNDLWLDTSDQNKYKFWDGAAWQYKQDLVLAASVTAEASARATADGFLSGKYTLTVAAGDVVTGMNITSSSGSGTNVSEVAFQADKFQIYSGTNKKVMFVADSVNDLVKLSNTLVVSTSGKVFIGTGTFNNSNTAFYVDSAGQFSLKDKLTWDGSVLSINGTVNATAGNIGGFSLGSDYIRDAADSFGLASTVTGGDDIRFWAGAAFASRGSAPFRVTEAGNVVATSIDITGTIRSGTTIEAGVLPSGNLAEAGGGGSAASSSYTSLSPDLTVTLTCDGQKRRIELVAGEVANASGSPQVCYVAIYRDGSVLVAELGNGNGLMLDASESAPIQLVGFDTPSAGSHTYNIRVKGGAGNSVAAGGTLAVS